MLWKREESVSLVGNLTTVLWLSDGLLIIILKITVLKLIQEMKRKIILPVLKDGLSH
jgi:hypothetical protein